MCPEQSASEPASATYFVLNLFWLQAALNWTCAPRSDVECKLLLTDIAFNADLTASISTIKCQTTVAIPDEIVLTHPMACTKVRTFSVCCRMSGRSDLRWTCAVSASGTVGHAWSFKNSAATFPPSQTSYLRKYPFSISASPSGCHYKSCKLTMPQHMQKSNGRTTQSLTALTSSGEGH